MSLGSNKNYSQIPAEYYRWAELASFLSRTFEREVDNAFLQEIDKTVPSIIEWAQSQNQAELSTGSCLFWRFLQQISSYENYADLIEQMAVEFASLFYGVGNNPVYVIESVYLGEEHTLYETPYFQVTELYRRSDYEKLPNFNEPEDHIANEFDFLAFLFRRAALNLETDNPDEFRQSMATMMGFLVDHLDRWGPDFCNSVLKATENLFYQAGAYLILGMLKQIRRIG